MHAKRRRKLDYGALASCRFPCSLPAVAMLVRSFRFLRVLPFLPLLLPSCCSFPSCPSCSSCPACSSCLACSSAAGSAGGEPLSKEDIRCSSLAPPGKEPGSSLWRAPPGPGGGTEISATCYIACPARSPLGLTLLVVSARSKRLARS